MTASEMETISETFCIVVQEHMGMHRPSCSHLFYRIFAFYRILTFFKGTEQHYNAYISFILHQDDCVILLYCG